MRKVNCPDLIHGGNIYGLTRTQSCDWRDILDYSANINPLGLPPSVRDSIRAVLDSIIHYPDPEATELKRAISSHYHVPAEAITVGNGAVELLYLLCYQLRPTEAIVFAPAFSEYERAARAAGAAVRHIYCRAEDDFSLELDKAASAQPNSIIFLGNPNNPTGKLLDREALLNLLTVCREKHTIVVVDESFIDFLPNNVQCTCRSLLDSFENLVVIHSMTKFYAIPGLRLGFALTEPRLAARLQLAKDPWNVNSLAQAAGVAALADEGYQAKSREVMASAKNEFYQSLIQLPGFKPYMPSVNYILIDVKETRKSAAQWNKALNSFGIMIRDCGNYPGLTPYYMRVAVKLPEQNMLFVNRLNVIIGR